MLSIIKESKIDKKRFVVKCNCGEIFEVTKTNFPKIKSCGCLSKLGPRTKDFSGQKFGKLTPLKFITRINRENFWKVQCSCWMKTKVILQFNHVKKGKTKTCGCDIYFRGLVMRMFSPLNMIFIME